jgi:hypothetical protein
VGQNTTPMTDPKLEILKRAIRDSIRIAQSEGVTLEQFLTTQYQTAPSHVSDGAPRYDAGMRCAGLVRSRGFGRTRADIVMTDPGTPPSAA